MLKNFVVYQHVNPISNDVFYIGSGKVERSHECGLIQRGELYNLYLNNNNLVKYIGASRRVDIIIQVLSYHDSKHEAMAEELTLIKKHYGTVGYKLVNSQTNFIFNQESLQRRSDLVRAAVSVKVKHVETGEVFSSVQAMADHFNIQRCTMQKRLTKTKDYPLYRFMDCITPVYVE